MRRHAMVKKVEFKVPYGGWANGEPTAVSTGFIYVDPTSKQVGFKLGRGTAPTVEMVIYAMMTDRDICRMAKEYSTHGKRKYPFEITCKTGMSGCEDWFINLYDHFGDSNIRIDKKHLIHVSGCGKINQDINPIYIGDFIEAFQTMMDPSPFNRKIIKAILRKGFGFKYVFEHPHGDITTRCSNIFAE